MRAHPWCLSSKSHHRSPLIFAHILGMGSLTLVTEHDQPGSCMVTNVLHAISILRRCTQREPGIRSGGRPRPPSGAGLRAAGPRFRSFLGIAAPECVHEIQAMHAISKLRVRITKTILPGFESKGPQSLLAHATCLLKECPSSETTSRNRQWMAHACSLPCTPSRDSGYMFPRERKSNRLEGRARESSGLLSIAVSFARFQRISAAADSRWAVEIAHKGRRRRKG